MMLTYRQVLPSLVLLKQQSDITINTLGLFVYGNHNHKNVTFQ